MVRLTTMITALFIAGPTIAATSGAQVILASNNYGALIPLKDDPRYAYIEDEIERMQQSRTFECRNIATAARFWWDNNRVFGFRERVGVTNTVTGLSGYLGGEARAPQMAGAVTGTYEMRLYLTNRTRSEILKTFRHESAHAAGITDERAASAWAEKCH